MYLVLLAFKTTSASEVFKRCKRMNIKYRRKLKELDDITISTIELSNIPIGCDYHKSGLPFLDWTMPTKCGSFTLFDIIANKYNLIRI